MRSWPIFLLSVLVSCSTVDPLQQAVPRHAPHRKAVGSGGSGAHSVNHRLIKKLKASDAVVIDVRTLEEFVNGHVVGAKHLDFLQSDFESEVGKLDRGKRYYLYCASGNRAGKALQYLLARRIKAETLEPYETLKAQGLDLEGLAP
jgi:phage shock protein E